MRGSNIFPMYFHINLTVIFDEDRFSQIEVGRYDG